MLSARRIEMAIGAKRDRPTIARLLAEPGRPLADLQIAESDMSGLRLRRRAASATRLPPDKGEEGGTFDTGVALADHLSPQRSDRLVAGVREFSKKIMRAAVDVGMATLCERLKSRLDLFY